MSSELAWIEAPIQFHAFALVTYVIAFAYIVIGLYVVPTLRLNLLAKMFGALFFVTCAGTHFELGFHAVESRPDYFMSFHMWAIHVVQAFVDWAFILAVRPWRSARVAIVYRDGGQHPAVEETELVGNSFVVKQPEEVDPR